MPRRSTSVPAAQLSPFTSDALLSYRSSSQSIDEIALVASLDSLHVDELLDAPLTGEALAMREELISFSHWVARSERRSAGAPSPGDVFKYLVEENNGLALFRYHYSLTTSAADGGGACGDERLGRRARRRRMTAVDLLVRANGVNRKATTFGHQLQRHVRESGGSQALLSDLHEMFGIPSPQGARAALKETFTLRLSQLHSTSHVVVLKFVLRWDRKRLRDLCMKLQAELDAQNIRSMALSGKSRSTARRRRTKNK